jgi:DNA-binding NarL/FixJ family response regulator
MVQSQTSRQGGRVLIADPAELVRRGIRDVLARDRRFTVVGEVSESSQLPAACLRLLPDVVLIAFQRGEAGPAGAATMEAVHEMCRLVPALRVIVLVDDDRMESVLEPARAGASGVLLRHAPAHTLLDALAGVLSGGAALDPRLTRALFDYLAESQQGGVIDLPGMAFAPAALAGLSPREREVLRSLVRGNRNKEIAVELGVSVGTVKTHLRHIFRKLSVADRTAAALTALQMRPPRAA